jgi:hypothetical protein
MHCLLAAPETSQTNDSNEDNSSAQLHNHKHLFETLTLNHFLLLVTTSWFGGQEDR